MIFEALQSEPFRFKFHSLESKILKISEFNLTISSCKALIGSRDHQISIKFETEFKYLDLFDPISTGLIVIMTQTTMKMPILCQLSDVLLEFFLNFHPVTSLVFPKHLLNVNSYHNKTKLQYRKVKKCLVVIQIKVLWSALP